MKKEKLTVPYVFVLALIIMAIAPGCVRKRSPSISIETYEFHCRNLSDDGLIAEFYRVDVELQEALDDLRRYERELEWEQYQRGPFGALGYSLGTSIGGRHPKRRVKELRRRKAIVLTIIHQRGLRLPVSVE